MADKKVPLTTEIGPDGREHATVPLEKIGCEDNLLYISPRQAIPVVFVPGIMGTPLLATGSNKNLVTQLDGKWCWFPDSYWWLGLGFNGFNDLSAKDRKKLLDPANTKVPSKTGEDSLIVLEQKDCILPISEMKARGWGTVILGGNGYGSFLNFLEKNFRNIYSQGKMNENFKSGLTGNQDDVEEFSGYEKISDEDLKAASGWSYPVYACGYNWLKSNEDSADTLESYINFVLNDCKTRLKYKCEKVIIVTHSMGGLVARMCAKKNPHNIMGIVHGVQPAIGAGTAYYRVRAGWEDMAGQFAIGANAVEVTPIFASPGPLQLLPNHLYGNNWLSARWENNTGDLLMQLPKNNDPYNEIYAIPNKWWRLINPYFIDPGNKNLENTWKQYITDLMTAKEFHAELGNYYFNPTYVHFGADKNEPAWNKITWIITPLKNNTMIWSPKLNQQQTPSLELNFDTGRNSLVVRNLETAGKIAYSTFNGQGVIGADYAGDAYRAHMGKQDEGGDGTVPILSGQAPTAHVKFSAKLKGFAHGASYDNQTVRAVTVHSIINIAKRAKNLC
ncbi:alpha/beta hydrolase [Pseudomonas syringae pv. syringae]|uniref:alpha/beta hydrolase n=1 Tax=Pseudomonas syringae TaxID=317 RepID=UPI00200B75FB|nr:alpha/beta hydrolase [Pseudomonas syringae]MCK9754676.1 alpha/beta hydrolase [Pseudomonas syringae pv. syringae]